MHAKYIQRNFIRDCDIVTELIINYNTNTKRQNNKVPELSEHL